MFTKIAYDITQMRPGCVLIQAHMGCDSAVSHEFPTESWLLSPTPEMKVYPLTSREWLEILVKMTKEQGKYERKKS